MASIICDDPKHLTIVLFGQKLRFTCMNQGLVKCESNFNPFPDVTEDQQNWINAVQQVITWFASASPRSTLNANPVFGQYIRLSEGPPGTLVCRALHDGVPKGVDNPSELSAVLNRVKIWFAAVGVNPSA